MTSKRAASAQADAAVPAILVTWLAIFRPCFTAPVWNHILVLVAGAVLAPGKRTVTQALRVMGLADQPGFGRYHEALNRARWNARDVARRLLLHLLAVLSPSGEVVIAIDDTIERRWGGKIKARGIYRDPVRSSHGHFVKTSGLRWLSLAVILPVPFAGRRWALPFLTVLAPSARWAEAQGKRHKTLTERARLAILQTKRWLADRRVVIVADSSFAALELIAAVRRHVCLITRLRLDASLFEPAPERRTGKRGRSAKKGRRLPKLSAVLADPATIWTRVTMAEWYGGQTCNWTMSPASRSGTPRHAPATIRWVLVRDPSGERDPQAFLMHRPRPRAYAILPASCAAGGSRQPSRKPATPGRRNAAAMVGPGYPAHHTRAARPLLSGDRLGARFDAQYPSTLVCPHPAAWYNKRSTDLQRRDRRRPARLVVAAEFFHVPARAERTVIPPHRSVRAGFPRRDQARPVRFTSPRARPQPALDQHRQQPKVVNRKSFPTQT